MSGFSTTARRNIARPDVVLSVAGIGIMLRKASSPSALKPKQLAKSITLPSNRTTKENSPSHNLTALSAIESNTGCTLVGELEITRNTSAVAVCCSKDSVSSRVRCCSASNSRSNAEDAHPLKSLEFKPWSHRPQFRKQSAIQL